MFFLGTAVKGARATAAWTSLVATVSLFGWAFADHFARRSVGPWVRGSWFVLSLLVALGAGVISFPRWQSVLALLVAVGAIVLLVK